MRGVPLYAVLVGIEVEGEPAVGVAHCPPLRETVSAARGIGCRWNDRAAAVSDTDDLSRAVVLTTDPEVVLAGPLEPGWNDLAGRAGLVRGCGDAYGHLLVATGRAEVMVDPVLSPWDCAPLVPILREAGGRFTDLGGSETIHGGSGVSTNGRLHPEVLRLLSGGG
jgi:histidinol-phosphatase